MFTRLARALFGSSNDRALKRHEARVPRIAAMEPELAALDDEALRGRVTAIRARIAEGADLDDVLEETFAIVREGARRALGMRHFDVQMVGGMVLHEGRIAEMKTGEGKTLVATLPCVLNALSGKGVHVVTVNDYLAARDAEWMGKLYGFLGLTTGVIVHGLTDDQRQQNYACDITYGTNNEFGFDYLRDNMKYRLEEMVQRPFNYAIVDEVDSILVDEARTPLIISGPTDDTSDLYRRVDAVMVEFVKDPERFEKDEKQRTVSMTEKGADDIDPMLTGGGVLTEGGLYDTENISIVHHMNQSLRAHTLFKRDVEYVVRDDKIVIIDEFTGRMMEGRRYSDGLHQALEAKEGVTVQPENQTLASITFQNYFRLYPKLAGMTGTAATEADEFAEIYKLEVVEIPTNVPVARVDSDDEVYRTAAEKYEAVALLIADARARNQPTLVGTTSIEKSELLSSILKAKKIPHNVLNARYHEQEAGIVAQAGRPGAITIATNMAGRGTDIKLGGNADMLARQETGTNEGEAFEAALARHEAEVAAYRPVVIEAGGLFVIGTERHESRRIDNQLRGRSGRQGDPGASRFFLSLEDDLMRIFGSDRMGGMLQKLGLKEGEAITHSWINKALEKAQKKVEARNFDTRKNLLKYDDVMNDQRREVYSQRRLYMDATDLSETIAEMRHETVHDLVRAAIPENSYPEQWDLAGLDEKIRTTLNLDLGIEAMGPGGGHRRRRHPRARPGRGGPCRCRPRRRYRAGDDAHGGEEFASPALRPGVEGASAAARPPAPGHRPAGLRPARPAERIQERSLQPLQRHARRPARAGDGPDDAGGTAADAPPPMPEPVRITDMRHAAPDGGEYDAQGDVALAPRGREAVDPGDERTWAATPRNAPCPCGSGKKYKHCHGRSA